MDPYFYKYFIVCELGEAAKAGRNPRRPADDLPPVSNGYRARRAAEPDRAAWLVRFGRRLAATATMWSL